MLTLKPTQRYPNHWVLKTWVNFVRFFCFSEHKGGRGKLPLATWGRNGGTEVRRPTWTSFATHHELRLPFTLLLDWWKMKDYFQTLDFLSGQWGEFLLLGGKVISYLNGATRLNKGLILMIKKSNKFTPHCYCCKNWILGEYFFGGLKITNEAQLFLQLFTRWTFKFLMKNVRVLCFVHFNFYLEITLQAARARGRFFRRCVGSIGVESSLSVFRFFLLFMGGTWRVQRSVRLWLSLSPSVIITRWMGLLHHSQTVFNAEIGHCVPRPA